MTTGSISSLVDELVIAVHRRVAVDHGVEVRPIVQGWGVPMPGVAIDLAEFVVGGTLTSSIAEARFPFVPADQLATALDALPVGAAFAGDLERIIDLISETARALWRDSDAVGAAATGAAEALDAATRPLVTAYQSLPVPADPPHRLHHLLTGLRYACLDAHVAGCDYAGMSRADAVALTAAWSGDDLDDWPTTLVDRGLLDDARRLTDVGQRCRDDIEAATDAACEPMWAAVTDLDGWVDGLRRLAVG